MPQHSVNIMPLMLWLQCSDINAAIPTLALFKMLLCTAIQLLIEMLYIWIYTHLKYCIVGTFLMGLWICRFHVEHFENKTTTLVDRTHCASTVL